MLEFRKLISAGLDPRDEDDATQEPRRPPHQPKPSIAQPLWALSTADSHLLVAAIFARPGGEVKPKGGKRLSRRLETTGHRPI